MRRAATGSLVLLLAAGCAPGAAPVVAEPAGPALVALTADVSDSYSAYWAAWQKAQETANPQEPTLADVAMDPLLGVVRSTIDEARRQGVTPKGTITHRIRGMEIDGDRRWVVDCVGMDSWLLYDSTGALAEQLIDKPGQLTTLVLRRDGAGWKATNLYVGDECV